MIRLPEPPGNAVFPARSRTIPGSPRQSALSAPLIHLPLLISARLPDVGRFASGHYNNSRKQLWKTTLESTNPVTYQGSHCPS